MNNEELLSLIDHDLNGAAMMKNDQLEKIRHWINAYDGAPLGNEDQSRSTIVWKLIRKQGEALISNLSKPFLGPHDIIDLEPLTDKDTIKSKIYSKTANHFWIKEFNSAKFIKSVTRLCVKEGTSFIRVGWESKKETKSENLPASTPKELLRRLEEKGATISMNKDGSIKATTTKILVNKPTAKPLRLEDCSFDPTADSFDEIQFFAFDYVTTLSEILSQPHLYDETAANRLKLALNSNNDTSNNIVEETHTYNKYSFEFTDNPRKKIRLTEYWGYYDINGDGVTEPVMALTAKAGETRVLLRLEKNKLPFKKMPFICIPLIDKEFSVYGDALASMIEDEQKFSTSIVRGIIDNMAASNNGTKFVRKNALDPINMQRLLDGEPLVEVNTNESIAAVIQDGAFNQLPSDVYNTLQLIESQAESITGITKMMQGIPGTEITASNANFSATMTQSQIRLLDMTVSISNGLRKMFYMWISMAMEYLSDDEILEITGIYIPEEKAKETKKIANKYGLDQLPEDTREKAMMLVIQEVNDIFDMNDLKYDVKMKVGTDGLKEIKINQINMLMQQTSSLIQGGIASPDLLKNLLADMMENMDRPDLAKQVLEYKPQPDPMQQAMQKAEVQGKIASANKDQALAKNAEARTIAATAKAQKDIAGIKSELESKDIDNIAKASKIEQENRKLDIEEAKLSTGGAE